MRYVKVPSPTQYDRWSDDDQRKADRMKGVRYYLPRPYLALKQSTPVAQRTAFISFHYDESSHSYLLDSPSGNPVWVQKIAPQKLSITAALAATLATQNTTGRTDMEKQAGTPGSDSGGTTTPNAPAGQQGGPNTVPSANPPSELHAKTGYVNDTDPITRIGDRMDIVYLPDFEEQFVIQPTFGLGKGDIETRLRNGWAAEVFSQQVDNSNLIPYIIDQVQKTSEAAASIFTTWAPVAAGLPPNLGLPTSKTLQKQGGKPGELDVDAARVALGNVLLFKIAEVRIAQPGIYPILKPREIAHWFRKADALVEGDSEKAFDLFLKQARTPWIRPDMAFIPCPPFTVIGFNTTSDAFLAPATERVLQSPLEEPTGQDPEQTGTSPANVSDKDQAVITAKLKADPATAKLGGLKDKLNLDGIALQVDRFGKLQVVVPVKGATFTDGDKNDTPVRDWINAALGEAAVSSLNWEGSAATTKVRITTGRAPSSWK
jgi:hypothetical protein